MPNQRLLMVVAQRPFELDPNRFCKLIPLMSLEGEECDPIDYPNDGEIWWMLTAQTAHLAEPGHLVVGDIEVAPRFDGYDEKSSQFQAIRESVRDPGMQECLELVDVPSGAIDEIRQVVLEGFALELPFRPTQSVMLRWRADLYGPFACSVSTDGEGGNVSVSVSPASTDLSICRIPGEWLLALDDQHVVKCTTKVSVTTQRRAEALEPVDVSHELLLGPGYDSLCTGNPETISLEPLDRKLARAARACLNRRERRELRRLLDLVEAKGTEAGEAEELLASVGEMKHRIDSLDSALDTLASAMLEAGLFGEDRILTAEKRHAQYYIEERGAEIQAQIEEMVASKRDELVKIEGQLQGLRDRLQRDEEAAKIELRRELEAVRQEARNGMASERQALETEKAELARQREVLQQNLEKTTSELREAGDEVVNRFLTIAPLLRMTHPLTEGTDPAERATGPSAESPPGEFEIPPFATTDRSEPEEALSEEDFFNRFCKLVDDSGFVYRDIDLKRFHLSVKAGALTVLGGASGTGKSSLPLLYSRALSGDEASKGRPDCLMVNVNPSWMDVRDLVGHLNTLEGRYYPAESGLYQYLVAAQMEHERHGPASGVYTACLDEMNLSQVEHYFSDFMMILEREGGSRELLCFPPEVAQDKCPFSRWSTIRLSPALRFIGTVNFDETTRLLSDRFLDRANLIELKSRALPSSTSQEPSRIAQSVGPMVQVGDIARWTRDAVHVNSFETLPAVIY
jgi:hypothetical protein